MPYARNKNKTARYYAMSIMHIIYECHVVLIFRAATLRLI